LDDAKQNIGEKSVQPQPIKADDAPDKQQTDVVNEQQQ